MIITNFKTYATATGKAAIDLAKTHQDVADETGAYIGISVQAIDLMAVCQAVKIPVWAQHIDPISHGSNTGHVLPELVKEAGAVGTLLNHSERRLERSVIEASLKRAKEVGLKVILCAKDAEEVESFVELEPDFIAYEPPEFIGSKDISVATGKPEIIEKAAKLVGQGKLIVGAGVKDGHDVETSIQLGAHGVLLASAITRAEDPKALLRYLVNGLS